MSREFTDKLVGYINAGFQACQVDTPEITRAENAVRDAAERVGMAVYTWDIANGFADEPPTEKKNPTQALDRVASSVEGNGVYIFRNFHVFLRDPGIAQKWQLLVEQNMLNNAQYRRPVIIVGTNIEMPKMLKATTTALDFTLPNREELETCFDFIQKGALEANPDQQENAACTPEQKEKIVDALIGLSAQDAENVLSLCAWEHKGFSSEELLETIENEKSQILRRSAGLEYIHKNKIPPMGDIGGFDLVKEWIDQRKVIFTSAAEEFHLDPVQGMVLLGPPGTGKSLTGKAIARQLGLPLIIADISSVFGSLVGQSERQADEMLATINSLGSGVVLFDEADKMFGGAADATGDSGVTRRIFGKFLTWLQEDKAPNIFVIMTMNRIKGIPPEFLRKGRFDEVFYTDLPDATERRDILEIHMRKRGIEDPATTYSKDGWTEIISATDNFVGSELEDVVKSAKLAAFTGRHKAEPTFEETIKVIKETITLATLDKENIDAIRQFCAERARPVSSSVAARVQKSGKRSSRGISWKD
jgi:hypothetical protein